MMSVVRFFSMYYLLKPTINSSHRKHGSRKLRHKHPEFDACDICCDFTWGNRQKMTCVPGNSQSDGHVSRPPPPSLEKKKV